MKLRPTTPKRRFSTAPAITAMVCALLITALIRVNIIGGDWAYKPIEIHATIVCHGWPTPFAEHEMAWTPIPGEDTGETPPQPLDYWNPLKWASFRMLTVTGAVCDSFLSLILIAATAVVVLRLEKRDWTRWQFSIADILSLIATTSMVLGVVGLDGRLSVVGDMYVQLRDLPTFDGVMTLVAIACAVWLIVSTVFDRLGHSRAAESH